MSWNMFKPKLPIDHYFRESYLPKRLVDASPATLKTYSITLRRFAKFCGKPVSVEDLTDKLVADFARWRLETVSKGTCKRDMDCILAIWRLAYSEGLVSRGPVIRAIHAPVPTPIALTQEQLDAVWKSIQTNPETVLVKSSTPRLEIPAPVWWSAMFLVCWDTAERFSPVFELKLCDVNTVDKWVRFPACDRKGGRQDSLKEIHADTAEAIERLLAYYQVRLIKSRVFRWASNHGSVWPALGRIMMRAGLPDSREFKFHCIRKSSVSHFASGGGDGCAHAGHSSDLITRRHYYDPRIVKRVGATQVLFRPKSQEVEVEPPADREPPKPAADWADWL